MPSLGRIWAEFDAVGAKLDRKRPTFGADSKQLYVDVQSSAKFDRGHPGPVRSGPLSTCQFCPKLARMRPLLGRSRPGVARCSPSSPPNALERADPRRSCNEPLPEEPGRPTRHQNWQGGFPNAIGPRRAWRDAGNPWRSSLESARNLLCDFAVAGPFPGKRCVVGPDARRAYTHDAPSCSGRQGPDIVPSGKTHDSRKLRRYSTTAPATRPTASASDARGLSPSR